MSEYVYIKKLSNMGAKEHGKQGAINMLPHIITLIMNNTKVQNPQHVNELYIGAPPPV